MVWSPGFYLHVKNNGAGIWVLIIFLALHFLAAYCKFSVEDWVSIDCGSDDFSFDDNLNLWDTDDLYTDAGINKLIRIDQPINLLNTLRSFPNSDQRNCYALPKIQQNLRYLVRSAFLYGNYDSLNRPPSFDLRFDGRILSPIKIKAIADVVNDELVYSSEDSGVMNVCLEKKNGEGDPFVSSLQAIPMDDGLYSEMPLNESFRLVTRIHFGKVEDGLFDSTDDYERSWTSTTTPPNCKNVSTLIDFESPKNQPPPFIQADAIESSHVSLPIILTVDFSDSTSSSQWAYFVFYFTETRDFDIFNSSSSSNRTMNILINGQEMSTFTTDRNKCTVITIYPVLISSSTVNVTLVAADSTGAPPLINAMEVFSKISTTSGDNGAPGRPTSMSIILMLLVCILATST